MNEGITQFLNSYVESTAPGYAVLLKGAWGSGKSYFIRNWIRSLKDETPEAEDDVVLKPIYVSLYGLGASTEMQEAIRKELYPLLYSKGAKIVSILIILPANFGDSVGKAIRCLLSFSGALLYPSIANAFKYGTIPFWIIP